MKVVFLSASGALGGAERVLLDLLPTLRGVVPRVLAGEDGPLLDEARALGVPAEALPFPPALARMGDAGLSSGGGRGAAAGRLLASAPAAVFYRGRLARRLRELAPDVVHSNGFKMHLLGALARPAEARLVWHLHDFLSNRPVMSATLRPLAPRCAAAAAVSHAVAADARRVLGDGPRIDTILDGIDLDRFRPDGPALDLAARAGLPPEPAGTVRVGLVATMGRWKGHRVFLRALARLPASLDVRGYVVGGPLYRTVGSEVPLDGLRREADALGLAGRVGFTGFVDDAPAVLRGLDVVVHASTQPEPFGLVIAEAMACGRPVIHADAGGAREVAGGRAASLAHPPGDDAALAERIATLAGDAELRGRLGAAGRVRAEACFGRARMGEAFSRLYGALGEG